MEKFQHYIYQRVNLKIPVWIFLIFPLIVYFIWELYWYTRVGLCFIKWHTHLMLYSFIWVIGLLIFNIYFRNNFSEKIQNAFLVFSSVLFSFFLVELFLVISGTLKTYLEKVNGYYVSHYSPLDKTHYHIWAPNKPHWITKPEYSYWRPTNSLGLPDIEWPVSKTINEKRILALGDSFTEGDGASFDSSYVSLLKGKLLETGYHFYVMNGGVCGSDPFDNYINLKNRLLVYQPDVILQVIASNDLTTDIIIRGGMERFQNDGTLKYRPAPWWEPIYAISCLSRVFFKMAGFNELLQKGDLNPADEKMLNEKTADLLRQYASLCKQKGIRLFLFLRPDKYEIEYNKYAYNFSAILSSTIDQDIVVYDLLPAYRQYISKNDSIVNDYFWKEDGHHNSKGYEMMAQTIYENLLPLLRDSLTTTTR